MGLIGEARLCGNIGRRCSLRQEFASALDAKRREMLNRSDGEATAVRADKGILRDAFGGGQLLYGHWLCQVVKEVRIRVKDGGVMRRDRARIVYFGLQEACQV